MSRQGTLGTLNLHGRALRLRPPLRALRTACMVMLTAQLAEPCFLWGCKMSADLNACCRSSGHCPSRFLETFSQAADVQGLPACGAYAIVDTGAGQITSQHSYHTGSTIAAG